MTDVADRLTLEERVRGMVRGFARGLARGWLHDDVPTGELAIFSATWRRLATSEIDVAALVADWVAIARRERISADTRRSIDWLETHGRPPLEGELPSSPAVLVRVLPLAVGARASPRSLVSGTYHLASLVDSSPVAIWSAVVVNVVTAQFLLGRRDALPDVVEALKVNDAPRPVLELVRRVPLTKSPVWGEKAAASVVDTLEPALWYAAWEPVAADALRLRYGPSSPAGWLEPLLGALIGARDGEAAIGPLGDSAIDEMITTLVR